MTVTPLGILTVGAAVPLLATASAKLAASLNGVLAELNAKLTGALAAQAAITVTPPTIAGSISAATQMIANLQAMLALPVPPIISLDLTAIAGVIAELQAAVGALNLIADFNATLGGILATGGVAAYRHSGPATDVIPGGIPGIPANQNCDGVILLATSDAAWGAMQSTLRTS